MGKLAKVLASLLILALIIGIGCGEDETATPTSAPLQTPIPTETADEDGGGIDHGQGEMAGEVTSRSAILQSRLTLKDDPLLGVAGVARFEISTASDFHDSQLTKWLIAKSGNDFIVRAKVTDLKPGTRYYYRLLYGTNTDSLATGQTCTFRTLDSPDVARETSFIVVTGMIYFVFHHYEGPENKELGYPALETILGMGPDFFVGTGDNVYYDGYPIPNRTQSELRNVWHQQFVQPRFVSLFSQVPTYWEKDDHDFRYNDADAYCEDEEPSAELGIQTFLEQLPVVGPEETEPVTYRTHRINKMLQIWLVEGRDYRSPNMMEDGPAKTLWGETQREWLKQTLLESDATFKLLISPTPMIGPDERINAWPAPCQDEYRRDNQTNPEGFKYEGEAFFTWLGENGFLEKNFYIICGDRHWKYHSVRADGFEEFSCGALVNANSRLGVAPGESNSTDPEALIDQLFTDPEASGGFLKVTVSPDDGNGRETCEFTFYDENGVMLYSTIRVAK